MIVQILSKLLTRSKDAVALSSRIVPLRQMSANNMRRRRKRRYILGASLIASSAVGYHTYNEIFNSEKQASDTKIKIYSILPLNILSRAWGAINNIELPEKMRGPVYGWYIRTFGVDLDEAAIKDLQHYRNLGEFFRRQLSPNCRLVDIEHGLVSPADGKVLHFGPVEDGHTEQVKGVKYSLRQFLGPQNWPSMHNQYTYTPYLQGASGDEDHTSYQSKLLCSPDNIPKKLFHCIIYLAPGDYHGFHSPVEWIVSFRRHFPGALLSVSPAVARWVPSLFNVNERAVYIGEWKHGFFSMAPVGATNVGSIKVFFDDTLQTNQRKRNKKVLFNDEAFARRDLGGITLKKGEPFGEFNLGSSIVLIFEAPEDFEFNIKPGQKVKYGQALGVNKDEHISKQEKVGS